MLVSEVAEEQMEAQTVTQAETQVQHEHTSASAPIPTQLYKKVIVRESSEAVQLMNEMMAHSRIDPLSTAHAAPMDGQRCG